MKFTFIYTLLMKIIFLSCITGRMKLLYNLVQATKYILVYKNTSCDIIFLQVFAESKEKFNVEVALRNEQQNGVPQLECITPLRLLLASEKDAERWKREVKDMETHNKNRCQKSQWNTDHVNIVEYLRKRLKLERYEYIIYYQHY
jgi:hypothetical protein